MAAIDPTIFPDSGGASVRWAPVYIEPMIGSGEQLTACVVVVADSGAFSVDVALRAKALKCMYGDQAEVLLAVVDLIQISIQDHLALGGALSEWVSPIRNSVLGPIRPAVGADITEVSHRAMRLVASLSEVFEGDGAAVPDTTANTPDVDRWLQQIRASVRDRSERLDVRFNGEVFIRPGASPTKIGYLGDRIAANFDTLVPGSNLSNRRIRAKARLVDLQILRDQVDIIMPRTSYELMLWVPEKHSPGFSQRSLDATFAALSELEEFGDKHELRVLALRAPEDAASRILELEAA